MKVIIEQNTNRIYIRDNKGNQLMVKSCETNDELNYVADALVKALGTRSLKVVRELI